MKYIYTVGYTIFNQNGNIDITEMFNTLRTFNIDFLIDIRSVPFSRTFPQCNANSMKMKLEAKKKGITYLHIPELGAQADGRDIFSRASEIFPENWIFPINKSYRPEKTPLESFELIVDFVKLRKDKTFLKGIKRIEHAYERDYVLCIMCAEKDPINCHRYFLVSKVLENKYSKWLEVKHIVKDTNKYSTVSNQYLNQRIENIIVSDNKMSSIKEDRIKDIADRYWNVFHGWKKD